MPPLPLLFQPLSVRGVTFPNRVVISPMCQYSATDGFANEWHFSHLSTYARGRAGCIFFEASAVKEYGRITHGDLGIWSDAHGEAMQPIVEFIKSHGCIAALQLAHAGRKASMQRPWFGNGALNDEDVQRGDRPWPISAPTDEPLDDGWLKPSAMSATDIADVVDSFAAAAVRAEAAGFDVVEIHGAHGYLIQTFLSPLSNTRGDAYGGDRKGRMRVALEVTEAVRAVWPEEKPLFFRVSSVDGLEGGWELDDSVALAQELKFRGVDVIDCSSGGNTPKGATNASIGRGLGFQVPFAARMRKETGLLSQAVGLILDGPQAEEILQAGDADLIAIGREALYDPFWALHQAQEMGIDDAFSLWPEQYGWWLERRSHGLRKILDTPH